MRLYVDDLFLYYRLNDHIDDKTKLPILIFPEGKLIFFIMKISQLYYTHLGFLV